MTIKRKKKVQIKSQFSPAILVLENKSFFKGMGIGYEGDATGEICFNTSLTGYQEIISDPSYAGQIINFTFPHIGNVGTNNEDIDPLNIGKIIKKVCEKENPKLIILGKQAIDDDCNQTGQILATLLKYPQATFASKVEKNTDDTLNVTREVDGGLETIKVKIPCVVTTDLRLNEPRYASLPNIMKAKQKKIDILDINELSLDLKKRVEILEVNDPPERKPGIVVPDVDSLVDKLKNEAKIL